VFEQFVSSAEDAAQRQKAGETGGGSPAKHDVRSVLALAAGDPPPVRVLPAMAGFSSLALIVRSTSLASCGVPLDVPLVGTAKR
jgi:hypothetical protein